MSRVLGSAMLVMLLAAGMGCHSNKVKTTSMDTQQPVPAKDSTATVAAKVPAVDSVFQRFQQGIRKALPLQVASVVYFPLPGSELCAGAAGNNGRITASQFAGAFGCLFSNNARALITGATCKENMQVVDSTDLRWQSDFAAVKTLVDHHYPVYELYFEYAHTNSAGREKGRFYGYLFGVVNKEYKLCLLYQNAG